ncbi:MAG: hypothetical protein HY800_02295 [Ignavibacteriales bacterium]|nr:hypothetical protein [Ignavibacteriales bacterium]
MISESFSAEALAQAEERKNNHTRRTVMMGTSSWAVSSSDTITLSGSANILRYDTPSLENDDDRDELWYLLNLTTSHQINRHLYLRSAIDLNLSHLVYLFSTRSADNNWNRIIRLSPTIIYSPFSDLRSTNTFEVLANYTVYDFEYLAPQPRSFVFRQFGFLDSTSINLTNRIGIEWFSYLRLYERGEFNWDSFTERPVNSFEDKTIVANIRYSLTKSLLFSLGFRYFSQLRFDHMKNERRLENFLQSMGPTTSIEVANDRISFVVRGWYENQTQTNQKTRTFTTMVMNLSVHI